LLQPFFVADSHEYSNAGTNFCPEYQPRMALFLVGPNAMKVKVFEVVLHKLPSGKSPASALEEQLNGFLAQSPGLHVVATHINTVVAPAEPNAMPSSDESTIIIFCAVFYTE
jgi:hypothetical protein